LTRHLWPRSGSNEDDGEVVQQSQVSAVVRKRICKRDGADLAEPGETWWPSGDEQLKYAEVGPVV